MDHIENSRERRRLSRNFENKNQSTFELEKPLDYKFENNSVTYPRTTRTPVKISRSSYSDVKTVTSDKNRHIEKDDADDEENSHELATPKQYIRRGSFSPERTDENPSDHDNVKSKNASSTAILHKREKRRKTKRKRANQDKRLSSTRENDEENIDEDWSSMKRQGSSSPARREYRDSNEFVKKKRERSRGGGGHENEMPIADILRKAETLRKAQENNSRNQYEEPVALPQLTTDTIYVQGRNGFSAVKIPAEQIVRGHRDPDSGETIMYPIKVAILAQKAWKNAGLIYQGLLAGMAFMHFLAIQTYFKLFNESISDYSLISELYTNIFSFLIVMCIISAFDKFDLAHLNMDHFREIYANYAKALIAIPLYITVFFLHEATMKLDDKLTLSNYRNTADISVDDNSTIIITAAELNTWRDITLVKDGIAVAAWMFIALGPQNDMLLSHLQTLERYAQSIS